ncbi:DOPA 4,5-dioxygenase family protein [Ruegeria sp. ANG-R]|uniref:DOPA 4,5-dioxygenase family protein n=1 Tax=Ruegeria sp. ANG-R TaxID=1577903 RepID=UPI000B108090|nr:DOPA 4,5-dioxygenase family protein [Ruegeria sp. ANG-R]
MGFPSEVFHQAFRWMILNRRGLTIFTHPEIGDHLTDHRDRAVWMGETLEFDLSIFD